MIRADPPRAPLLRCWPLRWPCCCRCRAGPGEAAVMRRATELREAPGDDGPQRRRAAGRSRRHPHWASARAPGCRCAPRPAPPAGCTCSTSARPRAATAAAAAAGGALRGVTGLFGGSPPAAHDRATSTSASAAWTRRTWPRPSPTPAPSRRWKPCARAKRQARQFARDAPLAPRRSSRCPRRRAAPRSHRRRHTPCNRWRHADAPALPLLLAAACRRARADARRSARSATSSAAAAAGNLAGRRHPAAPAPPRPPRPAATCSQLLSQSVGTIDEPQGDRDRPPAGRGAAGQQAAAPGRRAAALREPAGALDRLQSGRPQLPWTFGVLDDPGFNAFAAPGGYVFVTKGLVDRVDEAELAGILAHEITHVTERHHLQALRAKARAGLATQLLASQTAQQRRSARCVRADAGAGQNLYSSGLDQGDEFEPDRQGVALAARAGFDPYGLPGGAAAAAHRGAGQPAVHAVAVARTRRRSSGWSCWSRRWAAGWTRWPASRSVTHRAADLAARAKPLTRARGRGCQRRACAAEHEDARDHQHRARRDPGGERLAQQHTPMQDGGQRADHAGLRRRGRADALDRHHHQQHRHRRAQRGVQQRQPDHLRRHREAPLPSGRSTTNCSDAAQAGHLVASPTSRSEPRRCTSWPL